MAETNIDPLLSVIVLGRALVANNITRAKFIADAAIGQRRDPDGFKTFIRNHIEWAQTEAIARDRLGYAPQERVQLSPPQMDAAMQRRPIELEPPRTEPVVIDDLSATLMREMAAALQRIGAPDELQAIASGYGDTMTPREAIEALENFNAGDRVLLTWPLRPHARLTETVQARIEP